MENNIKWNIETYAAYNEALRTAESKFQEERDRRYREVNDVKDTAHTDALSLAREIQTYKDEKANELREQINQERLLYVRKSDINSMQDKYDAILKPILEFVSSRGGVEKGTDKTFYYIITIIITLSSIANILISIFK